MKKFFKPAQSRLAVLLVLLLACAFVLVDGTAGLAKEPVNKKKPNQLSKGSSIDVITPFDGNRIYNYIVNNGDIVTDNVGSNSGFYWPSVPRTSRSQTEDELRGENTADYSSGLWICGTVNGQARTAIVEYVSEYIAGKILPTGARDDATQTKYRVYKIMNGDGPGVKDYDEWPKADGAPTNTDGTPKLTGDQTLWFVMNDLEATRHQTAISGSPPIGLEVQTTVFGFNSAGPLGDIMFVRWDIFNKGDGNLDSAFIGVWDDPDLGSAADDLVGCDVSLGLGFCYNGDPNDGQYGARTPALGFDFFQGPAVPNGSTNYLKMTSFAKYTNGAPAGRGDPDNVAEVYNYMTGRWANGDPFIDPTTNQPTKFIHAGDPATGAGDLDSSPSDRRFLMASGPFKLAKGDKQTIVGAKIIAPGLNPPSSIRALRFFDKFAQGAYDNNFDILQSPSVTVEKRRLDQEIILDWQKDAPTVEKFSRLGYKFQGYIVYQGESLTGPFRQIALFDVVDNTQVVFDDKFDSESGLIINAPVVQGSDNGLQRVLSIKTDKIFNVNQRLSNYRDYYFAVTTYSVNLAAAPTVVESPLSAFRIAPTAQDYGTSVNQKTGNAVTIKRDKGKADGSFFAQVVDPTQVVDASYKITFNADSSWSLSKNGAKVATYPELQTSGVSNYTSAASAPIYDGVQIYVLLTPRAPTNILSHEQTVDASPNDNGLSLWGGGAPFGVATDFTADVFGLPLRSRDPAKLQADLELRFTGVKAGPTLNDTLVVSGGQLGIIRSRLTATARAIIRMPFELWDIENNQQINIFVLDRNAFADAPWGNNGVPLYYRASGRNYITPIHTPYNEAALVAAGPNAFDRNNADATWFLFFESNEHEPVSQWTTGDVYQIRFTNPVIAGVDELSYSTKAGLLRGQSSIQKDQLAKINVVPNPYWAQNVMERDPINRFVRLTNLPGAGAKIRIFTLAGELVRVIDDAARAADGTSGLQYANWDLRNDAGIPIASGIYIVHVEVPNVGTKVLKAVVVMPEERLDIF
jgi:hypothetical protein